VEGPALTTAFSHARRHRHLAIRSIESSGDPLDLALL
jgi:hypothetical protein